MGGESPPLRCFVAIQQNTATVSVRKVMSWSREPSLPSLSRLVAGAVWLPFKGTVGSKDSPMLLGLEKQLV